MQVIGGGIDFTLTPSIAVGHRYSTDSADGKPTNLTELYISGVSGRAEYRKSHDSDDNWTGDPNTWDLFTGLSFISSPTDVIYNPDLETKKTFLLSQGDDSGLSVYYYQWHPSDEWSNPIQIQKSDVQPWATPAVVAWAGNDTRLDVFVVSRANNHLLHISKDSETDTWSDYEDLGGFGTTPPTAISRTLGTLDVLVRGGNGGLWHRAYSSGGIWSAWQRISGTVKIQGQPHAISISDTTIDVFAWGTDGAMLHKRYSSVDQEWSPADGFNVLKEDGLAGPPKAMTDGTGDIYIFAYSTQGELLWMTLGSDAASKGDVVSLADVPDII
ncbi:hypothetical protein PFICI_02975 [Pestalotiopsis fici W106-1]|uniref:PLL-like beta propeller domain-containing protein n=1 Tax=Pestalotiopsis fici (strain W106-1 / CGMCC3.15140) TaxID=1229662 RepID=W3XFY9_PESFW|nr:uncharacterized protein PFICI_02975 [Pestalotiopsis fici W106-1]ETS84950.1 hypothetical protein PFICI_02975 [Pestalotiopsis fici W106-1]